MKKTIVVTALVILAGALPARAQDPKVEIGANFGWTFSDGVSSDTAIPTLDGQFFTKLDPKDAASWGLNFAFLANENMEVGFLFGQQNTTLVAGGTTSRDIGDVTVNSYHGYFGYNFLTHDDKVRPFAYFGLGASDYSDVTFTNLAGTTRTVPGLSRFSTTWGAGVKAFTSPHFGVKGNVSWTPTYIKSDAAGWWCDPYWGCYVTSSLQYSNQWTFGGGIVARF